MSIHHCCKACGWDEEENDLGLTHITFYSTEHPAGKDAKTIELCEVCYCTQLGNLGLYDHYREYRPLATGIAQALCYVLTQVRD